MAHQFADYARQSPNHLALVAPDGRHWSRGELQLECDRLKPGLQHVGLGAGDCAALALPNCAEFLALTLALTDIGCTVKAWDTYCTAGGFDDFLQGVTPGLLIGHERFTDIATELKSAVGIASPLVFALGMIKGFGSYNNLLVNTADSHSDNTVDNPSTPLAMPAIGPGQYIVHYCALSLADQAVRACAIDSLHSGHAVILADQWTPEKMLHDIERYRVTTAQMMPAQFTQLLELPRAVRDRHDLSSIRHVICPLERGPEPLESAMIQWWEVSINGCAAALPSTDFESAGELSHGNARR